MNDMTFTRSMSACAGAALLLAVAGCVPKDIAAPELPAAHAMVQPATVGGPLLGGNQFAGICVLKPQKLVRLKAQVGGEIRAVLAERGARIKSGQVLATLDTDNVRLRRERSEIELNRLIQRAELLRFQITKTEKELEAIQGLPGAGGMVPRYGKEMATLFERRSDLEDNQLNQAAARIDLRTYDDQIARATIRAPFDGVILARNVEPGMVIGSVIDNASGGDVLFEIADPSKLVAHCIAKEADALLLAIGKRAELSIDGLLDLKVEGEVGQISPVISNEAGVSRREFFVDLLAGAPKKLLSGMNATVLIDSK